MIVRWLVVALSLVACRDQKHGKDDKHSTERRATVTTPPPDSPATIAIKAYANANTCEERAKLIVFPEHNGTQLRALGCSARAIASVNATECDAIDAGSTCAAYAGNEKRIWLAKQPDGTLLVNFRATELPQPKFRALLSEASIKPVVVRAWATTVAALYNDDPERSYVFELSDPSQTSMSTRIYAYIAKSNGDAKTLVALVTGNLWHPITVRLHFVFVLSSRRYRAIIDTLVAPSFDESELEHVFDGDGG
jgi:hypothetical protein